MTETQHPPATTVSLNTSRKPARFTFVPAVVLLLGALSYYLASRSTLSRENVVWLTPHEAAQALQLGKLDVLKFKLLRASVTVWNWYCKGRRQITMESRLLGFPTTATQPKALPQTFFTNVDGTRCWILTREELTNLKSELRSATGVSTLGVQRITTLEGAQCTISSGTMNLDCLPRIVGTSFDLLFCAVSATGSGATSQTNFDMAARVKLPNGGAVVATCPANPVAGATNYWYILSSQAIDPAGNAINL